MKFGGSFGGLLEKSAEELLEKFPDELRKSRKKIFRVFIVSTLEIIPLFRLAKLLAFMVGVLQEYSFKPLEDFQTELLEKFCRQFLRTRKC